MFGRDLGFLDGIISGIDPLGLEAAYSGLPNRPSFPYSEEGRRVYQLNVPGIEAEDLSVLFDSGVVKVKGESKQQTSGVNYAFKVDEKLDKGDPVAVLKNGVLNISFEKVKDSYKKIPVTVG